MELQVILANPISQTILAVFTIGSVLLSCYFYIVSKREKKLVYDFNRVNYIELIESPLSPELSLTYKNKKIDRFFIYVFIITNIGADPIKSTDIAPSDKLMIKSEDGSDIFDFNIIYHFRDRNNFSLVKSKDELEINFDFFDKDSGIIFQVISQSKLQFAGTVIGQSEISRVNLKNTTDNYEYFFVLFLWVLCLISPFFFLFPISKLSYDITGSYGSLLGFGLFILTFILIFFVSFFFIFPFLQKLKPNNSNITNFYLNYLRDL